MQRVATCCKAYGSLLRFKETVQQWQNVLDSEIWQLKEAAVSLFPHLYLSYNELPPELKRCFSYCAVFPKDFEINVEELIRLWIAQGYVRPNRRGERLELVGLEYFNNLAMRSFFQELQEVEGLNCVRTLTLSCCGLHEVPAEIGSLNHLRHLDLSWNLFETLPEAICDLYYLKTFDISNCGDLSCLPQRIEGLVHLRHLFNLITYEVHQIPQRLGKLTSLCTLTQFNARSNSDDLAILKYLNQLERLRIDIYGEVDFGSAELGKKIYLHEMYLWFNPGVHFMETPSCIESMELPPNLQQLALDMYPRNQLPSWLVTKSLVNNLTKLIINGPRNVSSLTDLWKLSSLEELRLIRVEKLECLGKEFFGITIALHENSHNTFGTLSNSETSSSAEAAAFPNLRKLHFQCCPNWTNWKT
nr:putative disease resistance protein RGA4 [Coffea arabica]